MRPPSPCAKVNSLSNVVERIKDFTKYAYISASRSAAANLLEPCMFPRSEILLHSYRLKYWTGRPNLFADQRELWTEEKSS